MSNGSTAGVFYKNGFSTNLNKTNRHWLFDN